MEDLLEYVKRDGRICPMPPAWAELQKILDRIPTDEKAPIALILGGWHYSSNLEKMVCLALQIEYANNHGHLETVESFLRQLTDDKWHYIGKR